MIEIQSIQGKTYGVYGLGRTGKATLDCLMRSGAHYYAYDDNREMHSVLASKGYRITTPIAWDWSMIDALVLSPGIPHILPVPHEIARLAEQHHVPIITDIDLLMRANLDATMVGVTGTNGKSTTTALIGYALQHAGEKAIVAGNIGSSPLDYSWTGSPLYGVLEMSSFQLERLHQNRLNAAVFLNLTTDHLDRHGSIEGYVAAKSRIFQSADLKLAVVGIDQPVMEKVYENLRDKTCETIPVSCVRPLENGVYVLQGELYDTHGKKGKVFDFSSCRYLRGKHNAQNMAVSYALLRSFGVESSAILEAFESFRGLPHRTEWVGALNQVIFVNDSKATNVESACYALNSYENIYWIVGGKYKNDPLGALDPYLKNVKKAYGIGSSADMFEAYFEEKIPFEKQGALEEAFCAAYRDADASGKPAVVLLSPCCASFDQFHSFEHRGDVFKALFVQLARSQKSSVKIGRSS